MEGEGQKAAAVEGKGGESTHLALGADRASAGGEQEVSRLDRVVQEEASRQECEQQCSWTDRSG